MNTKNRPRFGGFGVYAMLILLVIILWYTFTNNSTTSDFTQNNLWKAIREEKVVSIRVEQNREVPTGYLNIKLKDGSTERMYTSDVNEIQKELKEKDFTQFVVDDVPSESWIMTLLPYLLIFGAIFILFMIMSNNAAANNSGGKMMNFGKSRAKLSTEEDNHMTLENVAGLKEEKEDLEELVDFLRAPKKYTNLGARIPKGVLLVGPPGTGKTLLAKAVAGEAGVPFFSISGSDFVEMFVGVGASRVRDLFEDAKKNAPCIVFIDEIDAVARRRGTGMGGGHDEREQTLNQMLVEMDGFGVNQGIIVMAALLGMYGIYAPGHFLSSDLPKLALALGLVMVASMAVFAYIIRGAFSISAKRKVKELGILKSIGMTPRQIRMMIVYEARWLSVLPILVSVGLGYLFSYGVLAAYSDLTQEVTGSRITASFAPWVAVVSMILSFLTVRLAASGPARQMGKLRPIEAVKESWSNPSLKKSAKHPILKKCFGFLGNISANSMTANKRLFRTCTVTLSLCMLLMFSFLAVFSVSDINNTKAEQDSHFNVNLTMESGQKIEPALMDELKQLPHIEEQATYTMANCAIWVSESELSEEFLSSGGFGTKAAGEYVAKRDGRYRIPCVLIGLEQDAYEDYLMQSGVPYSEQGAALIVNSVVKNPDSRGYEAKKDMVPYLKLKEGQSLEVTEKFLDSIQGDYRFDVTVSSALSEMPEIGHNMAFYTLPILVPMDQYYEIIRNFGEDRAVYNYRTYMNLLVEDGLDAEVQAQAEQICGTYLGTSDFYTSSKTQRALDRERLTDATMLIVYSLTALFGIIGISSAAVAILNSLYQRRKEFAMLRSVGLDRKGLDRLLHIEGFFLGGKPLVIGLPILFLIAAVLMWMQDVTFMEFIQVFPLLGLAAYIVLVLMVISGIYRMASRRIRRDIIVEVLKDENV